MTSKVWDVMNDLEMTTAKICSAREIIDNAVDKIQEHQYDRAETLMVAAYEFLEYYLNEFDEKFKLAWKETVVKQKKEEEDDAWDAVNREKEYYEDKIVFKTDGEDKTPKWESFWNGKDPITGYNYQGSTVSSVKYTDEELDAMCDKAEEDQKTLNYKEATAAGWSMTDDGFWIPPQKKNKVKKWVLPVEEAKDADTDETYYFVSFPDDLLEAAKLKEGDVVEWVDQSDGSYLLKKVEE